MISTVINLCVVHPNYRALYLTPTEKVCKGACLYAITKHMPQMRVTIHDGGRTWRFENGSVLTFQSLEGQRTEKLRGLEFNHVEGWGARTPDVRARVRPYGDR